MAPALNLPAPKNEANVENEAGPSRPSKKAVQIEDVDEITEQSSNANSSSKFSTGGIIYPPPELRSIVDKTAQYVARNGIEFESKIRGDNAGSNRLAFLNKDDPYNTYYQAKLEALKSGTGPLAGISTDLSVDQSLQGEQGRDLERERKQEEDKRPPEPEPFQFTTDMPNITALDLDIVKLTALFVAKRGRSFISTVQAREGRSYQFEFLRPSHSLFGFFNRLVEQYQVIMDSTPEIQKKIKLDAFGVEDPAEGLKPITGMGRGGGRSKIFQEVQMRAEFEKWDKARRKKEEDEEEKERAAFDEIDWQDFVVAGTVELTDADEHIDLPPPMSLGEVRNMSMAQKRMAAMIMESEGGAEEEGEDMDVLVDGPSTEEMAGNGVGGPSSSTGPMKIRKDYQPRSLAERKAAASGTETTTCPVCGEHVPLNQMDEHVRVELLDPRFREQRRELENKRAQHNALYEGANPSKALRQFAGNRTDIFGGEMEEEAQRKREQDEARKRKERETIVWDGHAASRVDTKAEFNRPDALQSEMQQIQKRFKTDQPKTYLGPQMSDRANADAQFASPVHMQDSASIQQQPSMIPLAPASMMQNIHQNVPTGPRMPEQYNNYGGMQYSPPHVPQHVPQQGYQYGYPVPEQGAPPFSLEKRSDGTLHPESEWIRFHPKPIKIIIQMPDSKSVSEKCDGGQIVFDNLPMQTTIGNIRDRLQSETLNGKIGASRLKLRVDGVKPTTLRQTLAHWNAEDGNVLTLHIG